MFDGPMEAITDSIIYFLFVIWILFAFFSNCFLVFVYIVTISCINSSWISLVTLWFMSFSEAVVYKAPSLFGEGETSVDLLHMALI